MFYVKYSKFKLYTLIKTFFSKVGSQSIGSGSTELTTNKSVYFNDKYAQSPVFMRVTYSTVR